MAFPFPVRLVGAIFLVSSLIWMVTVIARCADAVDAPFARGRELLSNSQFALANKDPAWPDDWKQKPGMTWETEKGIHYLRLTTGEPGKSVESGRDLQLSPEVKAVRVTVRYRTSKLKIGAKKEAGARVAFRLFDVVKIPFSPGPAPLVFSDHADGWTVATTAFRIPEHAVTMTISFGFSQMDSGTLDLAELSVTNEALSSVSTSAEALDSGFSQPSGSGAPVPIRREGERTIIGADTPSVWFIRPYVDVLGHDFILGITNLVTEARKAGRPLAVGVTNHLDEVSLRDEANTIYVFSYKNIDYPLPARARRLVFLNTWLLPAVEWPAARTGKKDLVLIGSRMLHNDSDGLAANKDRWRQIQKDDPTLELTVLDAAGYYFPLSAWRVPLLKAVLDEQTTHK